MVWNKVDEYFGAIHISIKLQQFVSQEGYMYVESTKSQSNMVNAEDDPSVNQVVRKKQFNG